MSKLRDRVIRIGEYTESSYKADYYDYEGNLRHNENHYFEIAASFGLGGSYKYNLGEKRFESASFSILAFSFEYSQPSKYQQEFYMGFDTGSSVGISVGGFFNMKGGWTFKF